MATANSNGYAAVRAAHPLQRGRYAPRGQLSKGVIMLHYALVFFLIALVAAVFGFGGIAASAAGIAKILFFVFLVLFIASLVAGGGFRRGR